MRYPGGKYQQAKHISAQIEQRYGGGLVYVPFLGAGSVAARLAAFADSLLLADADPALVTMWQALLGGWQPPEQVSRQDYERLKIENDSSSPLTAFARHACSFGGTAWGGYCGFEAFTVRPGIYRPPETGAAASLLQKLRKLRRCASIDLRCERFEAARHVAAVAYLDPPYLDTTNKYCASISAGSLQAGIDKLVAAGCHVYVSEQYRPQWAERLIWQRRTARYMASNGQQAQARTECLYLFPAAHAVESCRQLVLF